MKLPSMREYPKEIHIKDTTYRIKFVRKISGETADTLATCDPQDRVIRIKMGQSITEIFNCFLHELLHAIEFEYDVKVSHPAIYAFEKGISDVLMQNF